MSTISKVPGRVQTPRDVAAREPTEARGASQASTTALVLATEQALAPQPLDGATKKTIDQSIGAVLSGAVELTKLAIEHPKASLAIAGAATFVVGAFGLVSPFVGIMGGVVSVSTLANSGR